MESNEVKTYNGFIGIVKPGEDEVHFEKFEYTTSHDGLNKAFNQIIELVTEKHPENGDNPGKIANTGFLPSPFNEFTLFIDYDQFDPDIKYNLGFFGTPIFGNMAFIQVDTESENGNLYPIEEKNKDKLSKAIHSLKKFEKDTGVYDSMTTIDKNKFLEEFVKEQNNILEESTKDIKGEGYEELQEVKKELEETVNE